MVQLSSARVTGMGEVHWGPALQVTGVQPCELGRNGPKFNGLHSESFWGRGQPEATPSSWDLFNATRWFSIVLGMGGISWSL